MKAIIIAAGQSNRLKPFTNNIPKCLLDVGGRTILQRQLDVLRQCGIDDISIVRGYQGGLINYPNVKYYENTDYENNNILGSLFYAASEMDDEFVFSYSDIIYGESTVERLLQSKADISLVVDTDWMPRYEGRLLHPIDEAELVKGKGNRIIKIGKRICVPDKSYGEFIGLAKFSKSGAEILKSNYRRAAIKYRGKAFQQAALFENAYLTDMMQELIDRGYTIQGVGITRGWIEIDTPEDLERAQESWTK